jgi:transcription elongation GreA/GreB family factor
MADQQVLTQLAPQLARIFLKGEIGKAATEISEDETPLLVVYANLQASGQRAGLHLVVATDRRVMFVSRFGTEEEKITSVSYTQMAAEGERASPFGAALEIATLGALPQIVKVRKHAHEYAIRGIRPLRRGAQFLRLVEDQIDKQQAQPPDSEA